MRAALSTAAFIGFATLAFGCWQTDWPRVVLRTQSVNLRVTYNDKVQRGRTFQLHKAIALRPEPGSRQARYEKKVLKSAITDSQGLASFGEVVPGIYWITGGANEIAVTIFPPTGSAVKRVWVSEFDDGCINAEVERGD